MASRFQRRSVERRAKIITNELIVMAWLFCGTLWALSMAGLYVFDVGV